MLFFLETHFFFIESTSITWLYITLWEAKLLSRVYSQIWNISIISFYFTQYIELVSKYTDACKTLFKTYMYAGLQLRLSEQNVFHNFFLIFQSNATMWPLLKSSLRDDSNEWSHHRIWLRNKKVSILKTINFRPYL